MRRAPTRRDKPVGYPLPDYDEHNAQALPFEAEPGDAVMHAATTVHWTFDHVDDRDRNAMVFVYWGAGSALDPAKGEKVYVLHTRTETLRCSCRAGRLSDLPR